VVAAVPATAPCKPLGPSKQETTVAGALVGGVAGAMLGQRTAKNANVGARNGALLGAIAGGLVGAQFGSSVKTIQLPDGSVKLDIPGSVLFASGSVAIKDSFKSTLDAISRTVREYCGLSVQVVGHTDSTGRRNDNLSLSVNRAKAVVRHLAGTGIAEHLLSADGRGPDSPVADNHTDAGRQQNRRVELFVRPPAS
jgi:outer membrane protein OmpA-like peptidoglycan-associated protein